MSFAKELIKKIGDENTHILEEGLNSSEVSGFIDTGSYALNALVSGDIYGGVPSNKITIFAGTNSTGKTWFMTSILADALKKNPKTVGIYYDTESAVTKEMFESRGIDSKRVIISEPVTVQQFRNHAFKTLELLLERPQDERPPVIMILDSLGNLSTTKEIEETRKESETKDMTRAQMLKGTFRVLALKLAKANVPLFITNHVYETMSLYSAKVQSGGTGPAYSASTSIMLSKLKDKDGDGDTVIIKAVNEKSRFTKPNKEVRLRLSYSTGLDKHYGIKDIAEEHKVINRVGNRYKFPNDDAMIGRLQIDNNPEKYYTKDVLAKINEAAAKEFRYGNELKLQDTENIKEEQNNNTNQ